MRWVGHVGRMAAVRNVSQQGLCWIGVHLTKAPSFYGTGTFHYNVLTHSNVVLPSTSSSPKFSLTFSTLYT